MSQDKTLVLGAAKAKGILGEEEVKLPEMAIDTKVLFESALEPCHAEESHATLAVVEHVQPTPNELLYLASLDAADTLDVLAAQPLLAAGHEVNARCTAKPPRTSRPGPELQTPMPTLSSAFRPYHEEFPPLEKGRILKIRDNFENGVTKRGGNMDGPKMIPRDKVQQTTSTNPNAKSVEEDVVMDMADETEGGVNAVNSSQSSKPNSMADLFIANKATPMLENLANKGDATGTSSNGNTNAEGGNSDPKRTNGRQSMADMLKGAPDANGPHVFVPDEIQNIGFASVSNGVPAIYFSGSEIQKLAENVGHAIVGKFSHSIPTAVQIQKALDNIKFHRGFTWKYINAKHILIQCEELADYAKLLSGPKGTPVWFIDRHPMRVFKWSPDFDAYCESPIAAIWCNLIGLPIHLFDHSALFAIGKLLGTPIQVDRATANKTRLSFARICVEIDITKPPPMKSY